MLSIGRTQVYELIRAGELDSVASAAPGESRSTRSRLLRRRRGRQTDALTADRD
jgi:hypothetical protein